MHDPENSWFQGASRVAAAATLSTLVGLAPVHANDEGVSTVNVNCPSKSINDALTKHKHSKRLIVEITGTCYENVTITRDNVTLRGTDPASSQIVGVPETDVIDESPVTVDSAAGIEIENLTLAGGESSGLAVIGSKVKVSNCVLKDNGFFGAALVGGGLLRLDGCTVENNALGGLRVRGGGAAEVTNSTVDGGSGPGVHASAGAQVFIGRNQIGEANPSTVAATGSEAVLVTDNGTVDIANATIQSTGRSAVTAVRSSVLVIRDSTVEATGASACAAFIGDGSAMRVNGGTAFSNDAPGFNCATVSVYRNSTARLRGSGNSISSADAVTGGPSSSNAGGFALDIEMVSSLRIDGSGAATVNGNVESFNLSTIDLRKAVVNGGVYADGLTSNIRLRGNAFEDVVVNGDVFPGSDSPMNIRTGGQVRINGNIDCSNGANVTSNFTNFGPGGGYVNCPFGP